MILDAVPQVGSPDFVRTGERIVQAFCTQGYVLLKLQNHEQEQLKATQAVLQSVTDDAEHPLQPSKQRPGRLTYSYSPGQNVNDVPECWSITAAQAHVTLQHLGEAVLAALTKSSLLAIRTTAFNDILDDPVLQSGQISSSALDAIQYKPSALATGNCQPHVDKGLLTLISADANGLQIFSAEHKQIQKVDTQPGYVAIFPGYTLERATCGLIRAAMHQVVLTSTAPRTALAFKLRACPSTVLNLYPQLPDTVKPHIEPRYAGPISVAELMWVFGQTHESINAGKIDNQGAGNHNEAQFDIIPAAVIAKAAQLVQLNRWLRAAKHDKDPIPKGLLQDTVQVFVKTLTGRVFVLAVDLDWPVWCVKKCMEDLEGFLPSDVRLIYSGKQLENLPSLKQYKVPKEATLHIVLKLTGD